MKFQKIDLFILSFALVLGGMIILKKHHSLRTLKKDVSVTLPLMHERQVRAAAQPSAHQAADGQLNTAQAAAEQTTGVNEQSFSAVENAANTNLESSPYSEELKALSNHFYQFVPRKESLQSGLYSEADMHHSPRPVDDAAQMMGQVHEFFTEHPEMVKESFDFYMRCSQQKDFLTTVRALCAARASKSYSDLTGNQLPQAAFDTRVAYLKSQINL